MLNFEDEGLTLSNLKLKLAVFTSYKSIIKRIYINFCNPWPKGKHRKKRY